MERTQSFIFSSANATTVSANRDEFSVTLDNPITIPSHARGVHVGVYNARVWNSVPNIVTGVNDLLYLTASPDPQKILTIPQGLYGVSPLNTTIGNLLQNEGYDSDLITIRGDSATQKVYIIFKNTDISLDFTQAQTIGNLLGFDTVITSASAGEIIFAPVIARFNQVNSFLISCSDLVHNGIPTNNSSASILVEVPITAGANSQINYNPNNVLWIQSDHLISKSLQHLSFRITNERLESLVINEDWSVLVSVKFIM